MSQGRMNERFPGVIKRMYQQAKVGGTAGWTVNAGVDTFMSTCAASAANGTLIVPLTGLEVGDKIVGHHMVGQIESGGNAVNVFAKLYEFVPAAAASAAAVLAGTTGPTVTAIADAVISENNSLHVIGSANHVVVNADKGYFAIIDAVTLASTDIELLAFFLHIMKAN